MEDQYFYDPMMRAFYAKQAEDMKRYCKEHGIDCSQCQHHRCEEIYARSQQKKD